MRTWVQSLALLSGSGIWCCCELQCGVDCRSCANPRWLWCRPAAVAPIPPLAGELPCAVGVALKRKEKKTKSNLRCLIICFFVCLFVCFCFLGPHPYPTPRLGVELKLQLPDYTTATATPDPSHTYNLHHSLWQGLILNPLSKARDGTHVIMDASWVLNLLSHNGNLDMFF